MYRKIKICGISRFEDIIAVNSCSPDYIGFVFAESRRRVTAEKAAELSGMLRKSIIPVGVFVDSEPDDIVTVLNKNIIRMAQLHGNETEDVIEYLHRKTDGKIIKAVTVRNENDIRKWENSSADYLLLDNGKGTGNGFNWDILYNYLNAENMETKKDICAANNCSQSFKMKVNKEESSTVNNTANKTASHAADKTANKTVNHAADKTENETENKTENYSEIGGKPFFLAGGISMDNIAEAMKVPAYVLDLSGGAETDGIKDPEKIRRLTEAAHGRKQ